jgi:hypothetical protein
LLPARLRVWFRTNQATLRAPPERPLDRADYLEGHEAPSAVRIAEALQVVTHEGDGIAAVPNGASCPQVRRHYFSCRRAAFAVENSSAMLRHERQLIHPGQVIVGDKGFAGAAFEAFVTDELGAHLIRPDRKDEKKRFGKLGGIRQWVESVFDTMKGQLTLEDHGGRTIAGVYSRVAGRLLALATAIWHNWLIGAPSKRSLTAYDH